MRRPCRCRWRIDLPGLARSVNYSGVRFLVGAAAELSAAARERVPSEAEPLRRLARTLRLAARFARSAE